jgi:hypothetical protein
MRFQKLCVRRTRAREAIASSAQQVCGLSACLAAPIADAGAGAAGHAARVSYAVVWSANGGPLRAGNVKLDREGLVLTGLDCGRSSAERRERLAFGEVRTACIERRRGIRLVGLPTLVLELAGGRRVSIASLDRAGSLHELVDRVGSALRRAA